MKLSEAIREGAKLRPESHQDRFCRMANDETLRSDAWGAAIEAVMPTVIEFNWDVRDRFKFENSMHAFRAVQQHYFKEYFEMPAQCPGSQQRFLRMGGRIINNRGDQPHIKIYERGAEAGNLGGITSECDKVEQMAGMVDHLFYAHGWNREQVAEVVEWYENTRMQSAITQNFAHYAVN